jgi:hypothetical protein
MLSGKVVLHAKGLCNISCQASGCVVSHLFQEPQADPILIMAFEDMSHQKLKGCKHSCSSIHMQKGANLPLWIIRPSQIVTALSFFGLICIYCDAWICVLAAWSRHLAGKEAMQAVAVRWRFNFKNKIEDALGQARWAGILHTSSLSYHSTEVHPPTSHPQPRWL